MYFVKVEREHGDRYLQNLQKYLIFYGNFDSSLCTCLVKIKVENSEKILGIWLKNKFVHLPATFIV